MLLEPDCIPCILNMTISVLRKLPLDEDMVKELYREILEIPAFRGQIWDITSAEVIELVMEKIIDAIGNPDPFHSEKEQQNRAIMALYPSLKRSLDEALDPIYEAVKLAGIGNSIDFMMAEKEADIKSQIEERIKTSLPNRNYNAFKEQLRAAELLLYVSDNSGEIVLDKLLIQTIRKQVNVEVVLVVRSTPTLNDATMKESQFIGINEVATVIENGIHGPLPGTILRRCSGEVRELFNRADLIISKGGGNFDTLDEEQRHLKKNITFILLSKCYPYYRYFDVPLFQPILANSFLNGERDYSIE